jgi:group I intron endonuclease
MIREYKKRPKKIGVYCIRNAITQKCFVGISSDLDARLNRHRFALRSNSEHVAIELQQDWNLLGEENFEFSILDTIEPPEDPDYDPSDDLQVLEELWMEQLNPFLPDGYNKRRSREQAAT